MLNYKSNLDETTRLAETDMGLIEYKISGEAPYMLYMIGTPGPAHYTMGNENNPAEFGILTVSRPGYGRTPLESGKSAIN